MVPIAGVCNYDLDIIRIRGVNACYDKGVVGSVSMEEIVEPILKLSNQRVIVPKFIGINSHYYFMSLR